MTLHQPAAKLHGGNANTDEEVVMIVQIYPSCPIKA